MEPSSLAHTYITDHGSFKPAPQPPRKAPTAPKNPKMPAFALLSRDEEEAQLQESVYAQPDVGVAGDEGSRGQSAEGVSEEDVHDVLRQWFREQKQFQENVTLRRQHAHLLRQLAKLRQHVSEKQKQHASNQQAEKKQAGRKHRSQKAGKKHQVAHNMQKAAIT